MVGGLQALPRPLARKGIWHRLYDTIGPAGGLGLVLKVRGLDGLTGIRNRRVIVATVTDGN
jgi:hypothetical protein